MAKSVIDTVWLDSREFDFEDFREWMTRHIKKSLSLFEIEYKSSLFIASSRIVYGKDTINRNCPILDPLSTLYNNLDKVKMVVALQEKEVIVSQFIMLKKSVSGRRSINAKHIKSTKNSTNLKEDPDLANIVTHKTLKTYVVSLNLAGITPNLRDSNACNQLVGTIFGNMKDPDIIVINFQEVIEMKANTDVMVSIFQSKISNFKIWGKFFKKYFLGTHTRYICQSQQNLLGLATFQFVHSRVVRHIKPLFTSEIKFGWMGTMPTKGCLLMSLQVFHSIILFSNIHLTSGESPDKIKVRVDCVEEIVDHVNDSEKLTFDLMIFAGDMNLRCFNEWPFSEPNLSNLISDFSEKGEESERAEALLAVYKMSDEVLSQKHISLGTILKEGELPKFPTYKITKKANEPVYVADRRPSWTDRIMYYAQSPDVKISDTNLRTFYFPGSDHL